MNEIVAILSHADTQDKIDVLEKSIDSMILQGKKILISTHIQIPENLYKKVDFVIYDKDNPVIKKDEFPNNNSVVYYWMNYSQIRINFPIDFNHAFAVHKLIINALSLSIINSYDIIHFINYDYVINDEEVLKKHCQLLNKCDIVSYDWTGHGAPDNNRISSSFFSAKTSTLLQTLSVVNNKEKYCNFDIPIYEEFLHKICESLIVENISITELFEKNTIASKSILDEYIITLNDQTSLRIFLCKKNNDYYLVISNEHSRRVCINNIDFYTTQLVHILKLTEELINKGLEIKFEELNLKRSFNSNTPFADCEIIDPLSIDKRLIQTKKYTIEEYCDDTKTKRWDIINFLAKKYQFKNYLEIGVNDGQCIRKIDVQYKDGVDPSPGSEVGGCFVPEINFEMTSDEFFEKHIQKKYDIIFIDGLHHSEQVDKDIKNSLSYLNDNGFIILHDCNPPEYILQVVPRVSGLWNGDVWKSIVKLRCTRPDLEVCVVDTDWGLGIIRKGSQNCLIGDVDKYLDWDYFTLNREEILNIISTDNFFRKYE